jgi:S-ribosylhomocysteine lyase LuxS involved in autoinducer biosynthesis
MWYAIIITIVVSALSFALGCKLGFNIGSLGKCPNTKIFGITFDKCQYVLKEKWQNVTIEVSKCRKCGTIDVSWTRQPDTICLYENDEEIEDDQT